MKCMVMSKMLMELMACDGERAGVWQEGTMAYRGVQSRTVADMQFELGFQPEGPVGTRHVQAL